MSVLSIQLTRTAVVATAAVVTSLALTMSAAGQQFDFSYETVSPFANAFGQTGQNSGDIDIAYGMPSNAETVMGNLVVTNNMDEVIQFTATFTNDMFDPITTPVTLDGAIAATLTSDGDSNGMLSNPEDTATYQGFINDNLAMTMLDDFSLNASNFESDSTESFFNSDTPVTAGSGEITSLSLQLTFMLTPGDSASFTSIFAATPVPAPGALALLGVAGLIGNRRRRG